MKKKNLKKKKDKFLYWTNSHKLLLGQALPLAITKLILTVTSASVQRYAAGRRCCRICRRTEGRLRI